MGLLKKIGKALKRARKDTFKFSTKVTGVNWLGRKVGKELQSMMGVGAMKDMAAGQEETMRRQGEAAKLDSMNEVQNVTQFDDGGGEDFTGGGSKRKKRQSGAFSSGIGLNY